MNSYIIIFTATDEDDGSLFIHALPCNGYNYEDAILRQLLLEKPGYPFSNNDILENLELVITLPNLLEDPNLIIID
jgi:hypothetical protein